MLRSIRNYISLFLSVYLLAACGGSGTAPKPESANRAPLALTDSYIVDSNTDLPVLANDSDPDGDAISITSVTQPANGSVEVINSNLLKLTIDQEYSGADELTYDISDGKGGTATGRVNLDFRPAAKRPTAVNDRITGNRNVVMIIDALANDSDENGDALTIVEVGMPSHGTATIENANSIRFIPETDYVGQDSFTYTISDGGLTATATITLVLNVTNPTGNQAPNANQDKYSILFETATLLDVLNNDFDPENDALTITDIIGPDHGTATVDMISSNGQIQDAILYTPSPNYVGPDSLIYIISDGMQSTATTVQLDVKTKSQNKKPLAKDDTAYTPINTPVVITPFSNDSDPDNDVLTLVNISFPKNGNFTRDTNGTPNNFLDDKFTFTPFKDFVGTNTIVYTLSDGFSEDPAAITITVADAIPSTQLVTGSIHKGAVGGSVINLYSVDRNGNANQDDPVYSASSEEDGSWEAEIPSKHKLLLAVSHGGEYIDESSPDINVLNKRFVTLSDQALLESIWETGQTHIALSAYTSALIRKARIESTNSFAVTIENNRGFTQNAFGFDPFSVNPADPINPAAGASVEQLQYALMLGGFSNAVNASGTEINLALPTSLLIDAMIDDLSDCLLDAKQFNTALFVGTQALIDVTDINKEIRRFQNNNYTVFPSTTAQLNVPNCQLSGVATDKTAPVLTLTGSNPFNLEVDSSYVEPGVSALDNDDGNVSSEITSSNNINSSVLGSYSVTYEIWDRSGNRSTATRVVNVVDTTLPVINLNGPVSVTLELGDKYADPGATAADNFDGDISTGIVVNSNLDLATTGNYQITYDIADSSGNNAIQVVRQVNIVDTTPPDLVLLGSNPQTVLAFNAYTEFGAVANDLNDGDLSANVIIDSSAVDINAVGSYPVTYNVMDLSGNVAPQLTRTVNVIDIIAPVLNLQGLAVVDLEIGSVYSEAGATAIDQVDGDVTASIVIDSSTLDVNQLGSYQIRYNVADSSGNNAAEQIRRVNVVDTTIPVLALVGANPQYIEAGSAYTELGVLATDSVDGDITARVVIDSSAVDVNQTGTYLVTYNVTDLSGNAANQISRTVVVRDTSPPILTLQGSNPQTILINTPYTELGATANDANDGDVTAQIVINTASVNTNIAGSYIVTYDVKDAQGNQAAQLSRTVEVLDSASPIITVLGANPLDFEAGTLYVDAGATAFDSVDGDLTASLSIINNVNTASLGTYAVTYDVSDSSGNAAIQQTRTVNIVDTIAPSLSLNGSASITLEAGTAYNEAGATATDSFEGDLTAAIVLSGSVNANAPGNYILTYTVQDSSNNISVISRTVNVVDTTPPIIVLNGSNPVIVPIGSSYGDAGATATDNIDGDITTNIFVDTSAVNTSIAGDYQVTFNVNDNSGNPAAEIIRTVSVVETTLTLTVNIINDNGGTAVSTDFVPAINGVNTTWSTPVTLSPGPYSASQSMLTGYTAGNWGGDCAASGTVSLALGDTKVCSITNDDELAEFTMSKSASPNIISAPGDITYSYLFTNTGSLELNNLNVSDSGILNTCPITILTVGTSATCTATFTVTQAEIDAGLPITHSAVPTAESADAVTPATENDVANDNSTTVTISQTPTASVSSAPSVGSVSAAGTVIIYNYVVNNTGNVTLNGLSISDSLAGTGSCAATTIAVGANTTCSASYTVTQADMDAGTALANTVTASSIEAADATSSSSVTITQTPSASVSSTPSVGSVSAAGTVITYNYVVNNTGNVTLNGLSITDSLAGTGSCAATTIAVGANTTCSASYTVTQADMDAGTALANTITASSTEAADATASNSITITQTPNYTMLKTADGIVDLDTNGDDAGDTVTYNYSFTNTGNVTLQSLSIVDAGASSNCPVVSLAVGTSAVCNATYTLTQADVDTGSVVHAATSSALSSDGVTAVAEDDTVNDNSTTVSITQSPAYTNMGSAILSNDADSSGNVTPGDELTYTFTVTNSGNVTLTGVQIVDDLSNAGTVVCPAFAPGASCVLSGTYIVNIVDVNPVTVSIDNTGTATHGVLSPLPDTVSTPVFFSDPNDFDGDGLSNTQELDLATFGNPADSYDYSCLSIYNPDSDGDTISDGVEFSIATPPCVAAPPASIIPVASTDPFPANPVNEPDYGTATEPVLYLIEPGVFAGSIDLGIGSSSSACQFVTYVGSVNTEGEPTTILDMGGVRFSHVRDCDTLRFFNMVLKNGIGENSSGSTRGGGMRVADGSTVYMDNVWVENNSVQDQGGGIGVSNSGTTLYISNSLVRNNEVTGTDGNNKGGGGIWVGNNATLVMDSTRIYDNDAARLGGGGISLDPGSTATISNSVISQNTANLPGSINGGGGLLILGGATATVTNTIFSGNDSDNFGGGISLEGNGNNVKIYNNLIIGNSAQNGGGIYIDGSGADLRNNTFVYNQSLNEGGAIEVASGTPVVQDSLFANNRGGNGVVSRMLSDATIAGDTYNTAEAPYNFSSFNIIESPEGNAANSDLVSTDPQFDSAFYIAPVSPALNSGSENANVNMDVIFIEKTSLITGQLDDDILFGGDGLQLNRGYHYSAAQVGTADEIVIKTPADLNLSLAPATSRKHVIFVPRVSGELLGEGQEVVVLLTGSTTPVTLKQATTLEPGGANSVLANDIGDGEYQFSIDTTSATSGNSFDVSFTVNGTLISPEVTINIIP